MGAFFDNLNFTRVVILISLLGAIVLGYLVHGMRGHLRDLNQQVATKAPLLILDIQNKALKLDQLQRQVSKESFTAGNDGPNLTFYIARTASDAGIGQVKTDDSEKPVGRDLVDEKYTIDPNDKKWKFTREMISYFLYKLEEGSRRVKVTSLHIRPVDTVKSEEYGLEGKDWTFDATLTWRRTKE